MTNARTLSQIAKAIKALEKKSIQNVVAIGKLLHEASEQCEYGEYKRWLKGEFSWSDQTALNYRYVYNLTQKPNRLVFDKLNISLSALYFAAKFLRNSLGPRDHAIGKAIIEAAKADRVTYPIATAIYEKLREEEVARPPAPPPADPDLPTDSDDETSPPDDKDDDTPTEDHPPLSEPAKNIIAALHTIDPVTACDPVWSEVMRGYNGVMLRHVSVLLGTVYSEHTETGRVKAAADRAADRSEKTTKPIAA